MQDKRSATGFIIVNRKAGFVALMCAALVTAIAKLLFELL